MTFCQNYVNLDISAATGDVDDKSFLKFAARDPSMVLIVSLR